MSGRDIYTPVAESVPFDNSSNGFVSDNTQAAIEEIDNKVLTSASPGFSFGRSGNVSRGAWLLCETVPSNTTGRLVYINNAIIKKVFIGNEIVGNYTFEVYHHDGVEINLTLVGSVSIIAKRGDIFNVNWSVPTGKYLAIRVSASSTDQPKEVVSGLELAGSR